MWHRNYNPINNKPTDILLILSLNKGILYSLKKADEPQEGDFSFKVKSNNTPLGRPSHQ